MLFKKEDLQELAGMDAGDELDLEALTEDNVDDISRKMDEPLIVISNEIGDTSRWSTHHSLVFQNKVTEKFYQTFYSCGATEMQNECPFEYDPDMIEVVEVFPVQKTITVYEAAA